MRFLPPEAFREEGGVRTGVDGWIGHTASQGRKLNKEKRRVCEDMVFSAWLSWLSLVLVLDGHGGHRCAEFVVEKFRRKFSAKCFTREDAQALHAGAMPFSPRASARTLRAAERKLRCHVTLTVLRPT